MEPMTLDQHAASAAAAPGLSFEDIWRHLPLVLSVIGAIQDAASAPVREGGEVVIPAIKTWTPSGSVWVVLHVTNHPPAAAPLPAAEVQAPEGQSIPQPQVVGE